MAETLQIVINAKDNASGPIGNVSKSLGGLKSAAGTIGKAVAGGLAIGGVALGAFGVKAISSGSDVEEMMGKFNVVFGASADEVAGALDVFGAEVGRNKFELREMASSVQDMFVPMGYARDVAADMSGELVKLAVDVASFNNASDTEVMDRFASALVGNHEAVRSLGIVITETTLKEELARMGMEDLTGAALEQAKVQARLNLINAGTADAQGDAERTAGSWANTMRGLKATLSEVTAEIGTALLPVFTPMLQGLADLATDYGPKVIAWVTDFIASMTSIASYFSIVVSEGDYLNDFLTHLPDSIQPIAQAIGQTINGIMLFWNEFTSSMQSGSDIITSIFDGLWNVFDDSPLTENFEEWEEVVNTTVSKIQAGLQQLSEFFAPTFERLGEAVGPMLEGLEPLGGKFGELWVAIQPLAEIIGVVLIGAINLLLEIVAAVMPELGTIFGAVIDQMILLINTLTGILQNLGTLVMAVLEGDWATAWEAAQNIMTIAFEYIQGTLNNMLTIFTSIFNAIGVAVMNWGANIDAQTGGAFTRVYENVVGKMTAVSEFIQGIMNGIQAIVLNITTTINNLWVQHGDRIMAVITTAWEGIQLIIETVTAVITELQAAFMAAMEGDWVAFGTSMRTVLDTVWTAIKIAWVTGFTAILRYTKELIQKIVQAFKDIDWVALGKSAIDGIKQGVTGAVGSAKDAVTGAAGAIYNAASGFVGYDSPAKLFIPVGESIPQGIAVGIAGATSDAVTAANAMAGAVASALGATNGASLTPATVSPMIATSGYGQGGRMAGEIFAKEYVGAVRENLVGMRGEIVDIMTPAIEQERARRGRGMEALP